MKGNEDTEKGSEVVPEEDADIIEEIDEEGREAASSAKHKQLSEKLKSCEEERMKALEDLQRTKADFLNSKKRLEEQFRRDEERITEGHVMELLPLADSFEAAMSDPAWKTADEKWRRGVEGIYGQLASILRSHDMEAIDDTGSPFDPNRHEAVAHEGEGDTVVRVLQKGYRIGSTVIRPARVVVGSIT